MTRSKPMRSQSSPAVEVTGRGSLSAWLDRHSSELSTQVLRMLIWVLPLLLWPPAKEAFRLPKLLIGGCLALLSLLPLVWTLRNQPRLEWRGMVRLPVLQALVPLWLVATGGLFFTRHGEHFQDAILDLWIGGACLIGWSLGLGRERLEALLRLLIWPAVVLAVLVIDQHHHLLGLLEPLRIQGQGRYALTATAGNPGDLAAFLVLPLLVAQWQLREATATQRWGLMAAMALCAYALALTQTLAAILALLLALGLFWTLPLSWPRRLGVLAILLLLGVLGLTLLPELAGRIAAKAAQIGRGEIDAALTGRLDGWVVALRMLLDHPWTGVGHGAFRAEFIPTKLALLEQGWNFFPEQTYVVFANVHNEFLEVAAEWGLPGLLALGWAVWRLLSVLGRPTATPDRRGELAWAGVVALLVLCLFWFPWRVALVAYPFLLFLSWILAAGRRGT